MYGILTPLLVRPIKDGTYEIISGHRRKRAAALLGYRKIPVLIQPMSYEDAVVKMVDTNLHREHISFSEKAFAYRMKNEAMKQKVGRKKGQSGQQKKGKKTIELIGEEFGDSPKQIQRYIAVRPLGMDTYEMISGHRRMHAAKLTGLEKIPTIIRELTDDEAVICMHIQYVISSMKKNTTEIKNIKKYLLAALYNAPATMQGYYQAEVNHAMPQYAKRN